MFTQENHHPYKLVNGLLNQRLYGTILVVALLFIVAPKLLAVLSLLAPLIGIVLFLSTFFNEYTDENASRSTNSSSNEPIESLKQQYLAGSISEAEFENQVEELLSDELTNKTSYEFEEAR